MESIVVVSITVAGGLEWDDPTKSQSSFLVCFQESLAPMAFLAASPSCPDAIVAALWPPRSRMMRRLGTKPRRHTACGGRWLKSLAPRLLEPIFLKGADSAEELVVGLPVFLRGVFDGSQLDCA